MYCKNCGREITEGSGTCPGCGAAQDIYGIPNNVIQGASQQSSGMAIASIILGAVGLVLAWLLAILGYILGGIGLALGLVAMSKCRYDKKCLVGVILSAITLGFALTNSILGVMLVL